MSEQQKEFISSLNRVPDEATIYGALALRYGLSTPAGGAEGNTQSTEPLYND